jgi:hypothetical protein
MTVAAGTAMKGFGHLLKRVVSIRQPSGCSLIGRMAGD